MKMTGTIPVLVIALLTACSYQTASADLVVNFSIENGSNFSNSFDVLTGDRLQVGVYLTDDQAGGILETVGLFGLGLTGTTSPPNLGAISAAMINPVFDFDATEDFTASTINWPDAVFSNATPTGSSILLGTFQFDTALDGSTVFTFGDIQPGSGSTTANWLSGAGTVLDEDIFGAGATNTFQLIVTASAVPEPSSCGLLAIAIIVVGISRRRHRPPQIHGSMTTD